MSVLHRRQMGQLDLVQKCAHGELSRREPRRYTFKLACLSCEIEAVAQCRVYALWFVGGHVRHRTWITAKKADGSEVGEAPSIQPLSVQEDVILHLKAGPLTTGDLASAIHYPAERLEKLLPKWAIRDDDGRWSLR